MWFYRSMNSHYHRPNFFSALSLVTSSSSWWQGEHYGPGCFLKDDWYCSRAEGEKQRMRKKERCTNRWQGHWIIQHSHRLIPATDLQHCYIHWYMNRQEPRDNPVRVCEVQRESIREKRERVLQFSKVQLQPHCCYTCNTSSDKQAAAGRERKEGEGWRVKGKIQSEWKREEESV